VAEVASTFNEQLLARLLLARATSKKERAAILTREIDAIRNTIVRQTMFAEFERKSHASAEAGEPLTLERIRSIYRELLNAYFGPNFTIDPQLELECLRIPHFYNAFYVYKYATGLAAAITLAKKVAEQDPGALERYLGFLKGGSSKWPLDLLRDAGVDLEKPEPVATALARFGELVDELDTLL
jgi:oligoendopeptidase F